MRENETPVVLAPALLVGGEAFAGVDPDIGLTFRACVGGRAEWGERWDGVDHCLGRWENQNNQKNQGVLVKTCHPG